jgi:enterochelin esterase-like enzyme
MVPGYIRSVRSACSFVLLLSTGAALAQTPAPRPPSAPDEPPPILPAELRRALEAKPTGDAAVKLVDKIRRWFTPDGLKNGTAKMDGPDVAFAIEAEGAKEVTARAVDGFLQQKLAPIAGTSVWAAVGTFSDGTAVRFNYDVDGRRLGTFEVETWTVHPDAIAQPGVPKGKVIQQPKWKSKVFAGTERDWWIYVPAQYRSSRPAAVMVFQDGQNQFLKQVPTVFDNLIHKGDMPVTAAVFINPGVFPDGRRNRSFEYDTLSADYSRFLIDEVLPEVQKTVKLRSDPESRAIAGVSSGGICAFTVAWERPDKFRKVLSWVGSFTNIAAGATQREGGHNYPALIRRVPKKPIRVFLQDGLQDLDRGEAGSWPLANQQMERSLMFAGYDVRVAWGRGFHSNRHGHAIFPDSLRWLWRDHRQTTATPPTRTALNAPP